MAEMAGLVGGVGVDEIAGVVGGVGVDEMAGLESPAGFASLVSASLVGLDWAAMPTGLREGWLVALGRPRGPLRQVAPKRSPAARVGCGLLSAPPSWCVPRACRGVTLAWSWLWPTPWSTRRLSAPLWPVG